MKELLDLLEAGGPDLFRLLCRMTLREDAAEDLLQELFLRLRDSDGLLAATNRLAYARRAAIHLALDWRRRQRRLPSVALMGDEPSPDAASPLERLVEREEMQAVLDAMAGLSQRNAELLAMRYIQQESYETMASQLGKTPHQVRALCAKALLQLRGIISECKVDNREGNDDGE